MGREETAHEDPVHHRHRLPLQGLRRLLAKRDRDGLTIRRGDMQVVVSGDSTVAVTCYRDRCRTLNVLASRTPMPPTPVPALPRASAA